MIKKLIITIIIIMMMMMMMMMMIGHRGRKGWTLGLYHGNVDAPAYQSLYRVIPLASIRSP